MKRWQSERIRKALGLIRSGNLCRMRVTAECELLAQQWQNETVVLCQLQQTKADIAAHFDKIIADVCRILNARTERELVKDDL